MQKVISKISVSFVILLFLEVLFAALLFLAEHNGLYKDYINLFLLVGIVAVIFLNFIAVFICVGIISKTRHKSDISTLAVIGNEIQEAYDFGKIGLIVTDENDEIVWVSDMFKSTQFKMVDKNIFTWQPQLKVLKETVEKNNATSKRRAINGKIRSKKQVQKLLENEDFTESTNDKKIEINNRWYVVRYLRDAKLYIFKDVTDREEAVNYSKNHAVDLGIIFLDNYQALFNQLDDVEVNDNVAETQKRILDFARKYNLFIKKYKSDSYFFLCYHKDFERMRADGIPLVNEINQLNAEKYKSSNRDVLTVSMGIAIGIDDINKLFEEASFALDMAIGRGGNQVILLEHGKKMQSFGNSSDSLDSKKTNVSRTTVETLARILKNVSNVFIMGHSYADLDALGSSLGLYFLTETYCKNVRIIYDEDKTNRETRAAFNKLVGDKKIVVGKKDNAPVYAELKKRCISPREAINLFESDNSGVNSGNSILILTDVHNPDRTFSKELCSKFENVGIVDHHYVAEGIPTNLKFKYLDNTASSASELVAEMIFYSENKINLPSYVATFMLAGIYLDTNFFHKSIGPSTFHAADVLKSYGADSGEATEFLKESVDSYISRAEVMSTISTKHYEAVILKVNEDKNNVTQAFLAKCAQDASYLEDVSISFAIGKISNTHIGVSIRSDHIVNCQYLAEKISENAGGSNTSAAARISIQDLLKESGNTKQSPIEIAYAKISRIVDEELENAKNIK